MALAKATLSELSGDEKPTASNAINVQFNPTTLRLAFTSNATTGKSTDHQVQQYPSTPPRTLTLELVFDSADEGDTGAAKDVRDKLKNVEKFISPPKGSSAPPKVLFQWGPFMFAGVMTGLSEDIDYFSAEGVPLRAKANITLTEQDPDIEAKLKGPAAKTGDNATPPGTASGQPGSSGTPTTDSTGTAIGGETAADFAVRMGLDASAWRGLSVGLDASLSLSAGLEIDFSAGLSVGAGIGISVGVEAGASLSLEASFGLEASASVQASAAASFGASAQAAAGMALSAAGGVNAAVESVKIVKAEAAASAARAAFQAPAPSITTNASGTPVLGTGSLPSAVASAVQHSAGSAGSAPPQPSRPDQTRTPLAPSTATATATSPSLTARAASAPAPRPPLADPRSTSYGFGVPLRPRVIGATDERAGTNQGFAVVAPKQRAEGAPVTRDPTAPPWTALPTISAGRAAADAQQKKRRPARPCGCSGPCRHGGART